MRTNGCRHCRTILLIAFLFAMSMVLLNLLIALMSDAASKVSLVTARQLRCTPGVECPAGCGQLTPWLHANPAP